MYKRQFKKYRVLHYFKRIEFQHRGSPHAHILAWLDNAPTNAIQDDYDKAIELIDTLIAVSTSEASGNITLRHISTLLHVIKRLRRKEHKIVDSRLLSCHQKKNNDFDSYEKQ